MHRLLVLAAVSGCATPDIPALQAGTGSVSLSRSSYAAPAFQGTGVAYAQFTDSVANLSSCRASATFGSCVVRTHCEDTRDPITFFSAGEITFENTTSPVTLTPRSIGGYDGMGIADGRLFDPATMLAAHAVGADVPPFDLSLKSPESMTGVSPALTTHNEFLRTSDLVFTWMGVTQGSVSVSIVDGIDDVSSITCAFVGADGAGRVPASALAFYDDDGGRVLVEAYAAVSTTLDVWTVQFSVGADAVWADGSIGQQNFFFVN
ncbi:hypothetical protein BH11MYX1_BH11MYX1_40510 [soil metagenome]